MRKSVNEIEIVLQKHSYSIDNIICDVMKTFNLKKICQRVGFQKRAGYSASEIITLLLILPLILLKSVHALYESEFTKLGEMKKDTIYRLKNNSNLPWRQLVLAVAKQFQKLVNAEKALHDKAAFILDDTVEAKTGRRIEQISFIHDHVAGRKASKMGFKNLTLGFYDGVSFLPLDFSLHAEKPLKKARHLKEQYQKQRHLKSAGAKRIHECKVDKITNGLNMLKRAVKHGFRARYVLVDSWFSSKEFIQTVRKLGQNQMHIICGMKKDKRNTRYFEVVVDYEGVGEVKLYFCRYPYQKEWRLFLSTDTSLPFLSMMEIYCVRWTIEVFFKETKQHLMLGTCQSRDFDAQIAHVSTCYLLYTFLAYFRRVNDYESLGGLFKMINNELIEKNLAERLWELFEEQLQVVISAIAESGVVDILEFRTSAEYQYLKDLFDDSFLKNQLKNLDKAC
jgi:predicted nucleic acid-binding Zn finger protein